MNSLLTSPIWDDVAKHLTARNLAALRAEAIRAARIAEEAKRPIVIPQALKSRGYLDA